MIDELGLIMSVFWHGYVCAIITIFVLTRLGFK